MLDVARSRGAHSFQTCRSARFLCGSPQPPQHRSPLTTLRTADQRTKPDSVETSSVSTTGRDNTTALPNSLTLPLPLTHAGLVSKALGLVDVTVHGAGGALAVADALAAEVRELLLPEKCEHLPRTPVRKASRARPGHRQVVA